MPVMFQYVPYGDNGIVIEAGTSISVETHYKIKGLHSVIEGSRALIEGIEEIIPTYTTLMILYNPLRTSYNKLVDSISALEELSLSAVVAPVEILHIPVLYGGEMGPDLEQVAQHNGISAEEVVTIHTEGEYLIYMLGFTPGFPYLGGMSEDIATPRLEVPREKIPAGSVGIAGNQTGIYPIDSPGGWQIIGRTPIKLFDPYREPPVLLKAGQYIRFYGINEGEYNRIKAAVDDSSYVLSISYREGSE